MSHNPYAVLAFAYPSCRFLSMCTHRPFIIIFSRLSLATVTKVASNYRTRFSLSNGGFFFSLACLDRLVIYRWNDVVPTYLIFGKVGLFSLFFAFSHLFSLICQLTIGFRHLTWKTIGISLKIINYLFLQWKRAKFGISPIRPLINHW